jgi:1,4-dihydroxy-2-naphthoate octaprenyltransferase
MRSRDEKSLTLLLSFYGDAFFSKSRKETLMHSLSGALASRYLVILLAVFLVLVLLTVLFLIHAHLGGMPMLAQSTEAILQ